MPPDNDSKRDYRRDMLVAAALFAAGLAISAASLTQLSARSPQQLAQATPPLQSTPGSETKPSAPAEPQTVSPPPRPRPDADAQKAGAQPALPPAPAEKVAPPIKDR